MTSHTAQRQIIPAWGIQVLVCTFTVLVIYHPGRVQAAARAAPPPAAGDICTQQTQIPAAECTALVAVYQSTGGDTWTNNDGWLTTTTPCTWYGVGCTDGHVTQLWLYGNQLTGPLPAELGNLVNLGGARPGRQPAHGPAPHLAGHPDQPAGALAVRQPAHGPAPS